MKYTHVLFDLDGTLTDPKVGITKSVQHALKKYNISESLNTLEKFIGPPLHDSFMEFYSFNKDQAMQAVEYYREYFKETGIFENEVYNGIPQLLSELKSKGAIIAVATSKPTVFAERVIEHFNLTEYFNVIVGSNLDGTRSNKTEIVAYVLNKLKIVDLNSVVMIGDRKYDIDGATNNSIASIGVGYGYGSFEEISTATPSYIAQNVQELRDLLLK